MNTVIPYKIRRRIEEVGKTQAGLARGDICVPIIVTTRRSAGKRYFHSMGELPANSRSKRGRAAIGHTVLGK